MSTPKARSYRTEASGPIDATSSWLTETVLARLHDSEKFFFDLATDLPFSSVVRGRFPAPATDIMVRAKNAVDGAKGKPRTESEEQRCTLITARINLINILQSIESKTNNLSFLIRRTRFFASAQLEKLLTPAETK